MVKGFVYRGDKRTAEDIARKSKEGSKDYDSIYKSGIPTFKPKEGDNVIRILPSGDPDDPDWDLTVHQHYNVGADEGRYLCLAKMKDEECPVCEALAKTVDDEERDALRISKGCLVWLIDRDNEKAGPQLWLMPFTKVRNEIHGRSRDKKTGAPILVDNPEEGFDIFFNRAGTGTKTAYTGVEIDRDPSPLSESEKTQARWLDYIAENPLQSVLNFYAADHIEKVLMGQVERKKEEPEVEEEEATSTPTRTSRRPAPVEEEEEVEPTPRTARRAPPVEEEEGAPPADNRAARRRALLDDSEEEPEATPARSSRRPAPVEEEEETPEPVAAARRSLDRLKNRQR